RYMLTWTDENGIMFSQAPSPSNPNRWLNLGDWAPALDLPLDDMVHTFYLWRCADLTAQTAAVLGKKDNATQYAKLAARTKAAFQNEYYGRERGSCGRCGGNIFALRMGVPASQLPRVIAALKADISENGGHLVTGIVGTQFFFEVLSEYGL